MGSRANGDGEGVISFWVPGVPRPQGSKRAFVHKTTHKPVMVESSGAPLKDWRATVALAASEAMGFDDPLEGPVLLTLRFFLQRPKSHPKRRITWPTGRPDASKLARAVEDALTGICFKDDAQIVSLGVSKEWGLRPGVEVEVELDPMYIGQLAEATS